MDVPLDLQERGWTAVPHLVTDEEVAAILGRCDVLFAAPADQRHPRDKSATGTRHLDGLERRIPLVADVLTRDRLLDPVRTLIGPDPELTQASLRSPRPGFGGQSLHADDVPKLDTGGPDTVATAIVALVELTADNGATRVVPGSHRRRDLQRRSAQGLGQHPDEVVLTGPAGTAFVFSGHLLHAGGTNNANHDRPALQLCWQASGL